MLPAGTLAITDTVPTPVKVSNLPLTVAGPLAIWKATVTPELEVAFSVILFVLKVVSGNAANVIAGVALLTVKLFVAEAAK